MIIQFTVPGPPVPQSRPRVFRNGGVKTDSDKVANYKELIRLLCPRGQVLSGRLRLSVLAVFKTPKKYEKCPEKAVISADLDNVEKAIMDAMTGIAYEDDKQIWEKYSRKDVDQTNPRTVIRIEELG